jgi:hypothetical protein
MQAVSALKTDIQKLYIIDIGSKGEQSDHGALHAGADSWYILLCI